ncbi:TIGR01777 family oxidoreductase [Rodentibacter caecimuris]|uniref:TIGR01777 family protein n=1 Tax=Rodentibacter caecimuris TaxID=1796644 RepID=A0ABX3KX08_9PAST|nr:TIGR01777 family protein [Rodentibacter heylii]
MKILITGGTGLIGSALVEKLLPHTDITILTRSPQKAAARLPKTVKFLTALSELKNLDSFDIVINLAGEPIFTKRWTDSQKYKLYESRIRLTAQLVKLINNTERSPYFISASATGIYGNRPNEKLTEDSEIADNSFSSQLCRAWEETALHANTHTCIIRTGMVLSLQGGALKKILPIYQAGFGGKLGTGNQYWSWIALEDVIAAIQFLLKKRPRGIINLTSPSPITNAKFSQTLAEKLKRPNLTTAPTCLLKFILGERAQIVLDSQFIIPHNLLVQGFQFSYPDLSSYLSKID